MDFPGLNNFATIITAAFVPIKLKSERLPFKNIRKIGNKFLFEYAIDSALKIRNIEAIIISTESDDLIEILKKKYRRSKKIFYFLKRDAKLSNSEITNYKVMQKAIIDLQKDQINPLYLLLLQPTHPYRNPIMIEKAIQHIKSHPSIDVLISSKIMKRKSTFNNLMRPHFSLNNIQIYPKFVSGNYYIFKVASLSKNSSSDFGNTSYAFNTEPQFEIDINRYVDLWKARKILKNVIYKLQY